MELVKQATQGNLTVNFLTSNGEAFYFIDIIKNGNKIGFNSLASQFAKNKFSGMVTGATIFLNNIFGDFREIFDGESLKYISNGNGELYIELSFNDIKFISKSINDIYDER